MLNFDLLEKSLGIVSPPHFAYYFLYHILLTDQISFSDCLYFLRYRTVCALQLLVSQIVVSYILKLNLSF